MKPDMSKSKMMSEMSSPSSSFMITPTTLRSITQIFESEACLKSIQTYEATGDVVKATTAASESEKRHQIPIQVTTSSVPSSTTLTTRSGNTYFNLDSKSWQGGTTTVLTPTKFITSVVDKFESEGCVKSEDEDPSSDEEESSPRTFNGHFLPEPIVQTNLKQQQKKHTPRRTMITRSLSNMSNSDTKSYTKPYSGGGENKKAGRKSTRKGKKMLAYDSEDDLSTEEKERLRVRRQRNKEAAARCRKRRVDQTNTLQSEVDEWNAKKRTLEEEIRSLTSEKEELEFVLASHCQTAADGLCVLGGARRRLPTPAQIIVRRTSNAIIPNQQQRYQTQVHRYHPHQQMVVQRQPPVVAIKSEPTVIVEPVNQPYILPEQVQIPNLKVVSNATSLPGITKVASNTTVAMQPLRRPMSLGLAKVAMVQHSFNKVSEHGVAIDTPSNVVPSLSFDTLTSTGLTPTATPVTAFSFPVTSASTPGTLNTPMTTNAVIGGNSCSTQQRSSEVAIGSVSDMHSPEGVSLVSL